MAVPELWLELLACEFKDFAVLDTRGASGLARSAPDTGFDGLICRCSPVLVLVGLLGEGDSSTRGLRLIASEKKRGARFEAESAPDALGGEVAEVWHGVPSFWLNMPVKWWFRRHIGRICR